MKSLMKGHCCKKSNSAGDEQCWHTFYSVRKRVKKKYEKKKKNGRSKGDFIFFSQFFASSNTKVSYSHSRRQKKKKLFSILSFLVELWENEKEERQLIVINNHVIKKNYGRDISNRTSWFKDALKKRNFI